jgi:hypothetical protein
MSWRCLAAELAVMFVTLVAMLLLAAGMIPRATGVHLPRSRACRYLHGANVIYSHTAALRLAVTSTTA